MTRSSYSMAVAALALACVPCARGQVVIGEVFASDASVKGTVILAAGGTRVFSGSQVAAGGAPAVLRLARGGEIRICPGTSLAVSSSSSGNELLLSVSKGALEVHYSLASMADSIMTPDFQVQLVGPGDFHLGFGADERGATCVRGLAENTASVIVSEMMGDGRYQVQPREEVVFHNGRVSSGEKGALVHCGCPAPLPVLRAEAKPAAPTPLPRPEPVVPAAAPVASQDSEVHVQVDAPFVFRGDSAENDIAWQVSRLQTSSKGDFALLLRPTVIPPPEAPPAPNTLPSAVAQTEKQGGGFFKKIGRFFGKIFRG